MEYAFCIEPKLDRDGRQLYTRDGERVRCGERFKVESRIGCAPHSKTNGHNGEIYRAEAERYFIRWNEPVIAHWNLHAYVALTMVKKQEAEDLKRRQKKSARSRIERPTQLSETEIDHFGRK